MNLRVKVFTSFVFLWMADKVCADELRDVKAPVAFPGGFSFLIIVIVIALACVAGYLFYRFKQMKASQVSSKPEISPWAKAYLKLDKLTQSNLLKESKFKEYYAELSEIIRWYLEERFNLRAPEMTTEEFLNHIKGSKRLTDKQKEILKEFLEISDLVKFAKFAPTISKTDQHFNTAKSLIDQTKGVDTEVQSNGA